MSGHMDEVGRLEGYSVSASTTPPVPLAAGEYTPSESSEPRDLNDEWDPRDDAIERYQRELQQLKNRLANKDQELADYNLETQRHKQIKRESVKVATELHKARSLFQEEQENLKESRLHMEQYRVQAEQYKAQVEQLKKAAADASATAAELKQTKAHEAELEEELQKSRATVDDLRSKLERLEALRSQETQPAQATTATTASTATSGAQSQLSPKFQGSISAVSNGKPAASTRPAKSIQMVPASGSFDLVPEGVTRFTEMPESSGGMAPGPSKLREVEMPKDASPQVFFSNTDCAHQSTVGKVHLPGYGITEGAGTLAKVLLSRVNVSVYGPEYRRQQQAQYQQIGIMQRQHIVQVPVQPPAPGGHMPVNGMMPTQG